MGKGCGELDVERGGLNNMGMGEREYCEKLMIEVEE